MIDKVAFTGREDMLVNAGKMAKEASTKTQCVFASSVLPDISKISKAIYTSPFAPVFDNVGKILDKLA